jgi:hypothetical protein
MRHDIRESNGRFVDAVDVDTIMLICELDRLCQKAQVKFDDHGNNGMTSAEIHWLFVVARERPVWAIATLNRYGWGISV